MPRFWPLNRSRTRIRFFGLLASAAGCCCLLGTAVSTSDEEFIMPRPFSRP